MCKQSDGLFLKTFYQVAEAMKATDKGLKIDDKLADSVLTRLVQAPGEFDVLCCPNLYGDLVRVEGVRWNWWRDLFLGFTLLPSRSLT